MNVTGNAQWIKRLPPWLYKLGAQAWIDYEWPRHLFIETTATCNLTCSFCPREKRRADMSWDVFTGIVDEAKRYGPRSFSLHLFGEPLLYPKWREAIDYIKSSNSRNTVLFTTNGTLIEPNLESLLESGVSQVFWSWRPEAKFTQETKEKLRKWGKFRVRFIKEVTPPEAYQAWADWPNVEGRQLHSYGGEIDTTKWDVSNKKKLRWSCYHPFYAPAVAWNGEILLCCADPHRRSSIGKFPEVSVSNAWCGDVFKRIRQEHLNGKYTGICEKCDIWKQTPNVFFGHEYPDKTA